MAIDPAIEAISVYRRAKELVVETSDSGDNQLRLLLMAALLKEQSMARSFVVGSPRLLAVWKEAISDPRYWEAAANDARRHLSALAETMALLVTIDDCGLLDNIEAAHK